MRGLRAVAAASVLLAFVASAGDAHAEEPAQIRASARRAIVEGDLTKARAALSAAPADTGAAERAATAELLYVIDVWAAAGRPAAVTVANDAPAPDAEEDWERAFANGRNLLVTGHYAEAARRFDALVGAAPDLVAGSRAAELRALAREAAPAVQPAPPARPIAPVAKPPVDSSDDANADAKTETRWYGWQTLISDGLAVAVTPLAPPLGLGIYALGAPLVHVFHLNGWSVAGSLGVRIVAPTVGVLVGVAAAEGCNGFLCELEGAAWGAIVGVGIAIVVDATLLAREKVPVEKRSATIVPLITPGRVGIGGTF